MPIKSKARLPKNSVTANPKKETPSAWVTRVTELAGSIGLNSSTDISSDTATRNDRLMAADVNASMAIQNKTAGRCRGKLIMFAGTWMERTVVSEFHPGAAGML